MKLNLLAWLKPNEDETLACFGEARLVKTLTGKVELIGGTADDRTAARDYCRLGSGNRNLPTAKARRGPSERARTSPWVSLFLHEARI